MTPNEKPSQIATDEQGQAPKAKVLRRDQEGAVEETVKALESADRCQVIMPCGAGKTIVALRISEKVCPSGLTVVAVPTITLLAQTLAAWREDASSERRFAHLAVCSDPTVERRSSGGDQMSDAMEVLKSGAGIGNVTTEPDDIEKWLSIAASARRVIFVTHASVERVADALRVRKEKADLLIVDEAHRAAGVHRKTRTRQNDESVRLGGIVTATFPSVLRVFMTATPKVVTVKQHGSWTDDETVFSMADDPNGRFGAVAHKMGYGEAAEIGILVPFDVMILVAESAGYGRSIPNKASLGCGHDVTANELAAYRAIDVGSRTHDLRRLICCHSCVANARRFAEHGNECCSRTTDGEGILYESVVGADSAEKRSAALEKLRTLDGGAADRVILSHCQVLVEGVNVPAVNGVVFVDPKESPISIIQSTGRAMRTHVDPKTGVAKEKGVVIIPVVVPPLVDAESRLDGSRFALVSKVLRALSSMDDSLDALLTSARRGLGESPAETGEPREVCPDCGRQVTKEGQCLCSRVKIIGVSGAPFDLVLLEKIQTLVIRAATSSWYEMLRRIEGYLKTGGRIPGATDKDRNRRAAGQWAASQRKAYKEKTLSPERVEALNRVKGWSWDPIGDAWEKALEGVRAFYETNEREASAFSPILEERRLGAWCNEQRTAKRRCNLGDDRIAALEALDWWRWGVLVDRWYEMLKEIERYLRTDGRVPSQTDKDPQKAKAGRWASKQRQCHSRGTLPQDRFVALDALDGWTWKVDLDERWYEMLKEIERYLKTDGWIPSVSDKDRTRRLAGRWVANQRADYNKKTLSPERIEALNRVKGWTWGVDFDAGWHKTLKEIEGYLR
ncbi:MAG: helicase associated domain-containing protein, partial [Acidimicrobiales bacterium]